MAVDRNISIGGDASGNVLVAGDGNVVRVVIVQSTRFVESIVGDNPYRGLQAFEERHAPLFFGREETTARLWEMGAEIITEGRPRLLAVLGRSGSGKSSVVRAGLLPMLGRRLWPATDLVGAAVFVPADNPLAALHSAIAHARSAVASSQASQRRLVIVADQFETLFTGRAPAEVKKTFAQRLIVQATAPGGDVMLVMTMRSDFLGALQDYPEFEQLIAEPRHHRIVAGMSRQELEAAIAGPMSKERPLPTALIWRLIEQAHGREGALPLLQYTLTQIWEGMAKGMAPEDYFEQRLDGSIVTAIAKEADLVLDELKDDRRKAIALRAFAHMVEVHDQSLVRRPAAIRSLIGPGETAEEVLGVIRHFAERRARLVTVSGDLGSAEGVNSEDVVCSVAHEALITSWPTLWTLVTSNPEDRRFHQSLTDDAEAWNRAGRPNGSLYRPPNLDLLRTFAERRRAEMTALELSFFEAGEREWRAEQNAARRRARLARVAAAIMVVLTIAAASAGLYAWTQKGEADRQAAAAREAQAAAEAARDQAQRAADSEAQQRNRAEAEARRAEQQAEAAIAAARKGSRVITKLADDQADIGDGRLTLLLAMEALPSDLDRSPHLVVPEVRHTLVRGLHEAKERMRLLHEGGTTSAAFSPDGAYVVTGGKDGVTRIWDAATGKFSLSLRATESGSITTAAISPDATRILTGHWSGEVIVWDMATGRAMAVIPHGWGNVTGAFSPDGARIVTVSVTGQAAIWNITSGERIQVLEGTGSLAAAAIPAVAFSPDGTRIVFGKTIRDAGSGRVIRSFDDQQDIRSVAISHDGSRIATVSFDGLSLVRDSTTAAPIVRLEGHATMLTSVAFSPDGTRIVTGSLDGTVLVWDLSTSRPALRLVGHEGAVLSVGFSPDGDRIITGSEDGTARIWDAPRSRRLLEMSGHHGAVNSVAFSPDGEQIVTGSDDGTAIVRNAISGSVTATLVGHVAPLTDVAFSRDGARVFTSSDDGTSRVWDSKNGASLLRLIGHTAEVTSLALSPDGSRIATTSLDSTARIWDSVNGSAVLLLRHGDDNGVWDISFSPDGQYVATATWEAVRLWNASTGRAVRSFKGHTDDVTALAFTPDGQRLLSESDDGTTRLYDVSTGETLITLKGGEVFDNAFAFSPDGTRVASGSGDHVVLVSDARTLRPLVRLANGGATARAVAFSPDGTRVAAGLEDGSAQIWALPPLPGELVDMVAHVVALNLCPLSPAEHRRFRLAANAAPPIDEAQKRACGIWE